MSPRPDPEERRAEILDAALRCFSRTGYRGTSMDDIVRESGLSKGTLYWHFDSKQDLFTALFNQILQHLLEPFEQLAFSDESLTAAEQLRAMGEASMVLIREEDNELLTMPLVFLIEIWQEKDFMQHYIASIENVAKHTANIIQTGISNGEFREVDAQEVSWGLMAMMDGIFLYHITGVPGDAAKQMADMIDIVIEGLLKKE